jgi:hypothetical protein
MKVVPWNWQGFYYRKAIHGMKSSEKSSTSLQVFWDGNWRVEWMTWEQGTLQGTSIAPRFSIPSPNTEDPPASSASWTSDVQVQGLSPDPTPLQRSLEKISTSRVDGETSNRSEQYPNSQATGRSLGVTQPSSTANVVQNHSKHLKTYHDYNIL